jgi:chromatin remodeling complex protein RSC6
MIILNCIVTLITNKQCFIQLEDETGTVESGGLHQSLRKNPTEELELEMRTATCISKDKHIQIQRTEVVKKGTKAVQSKKCTKAVQKKDGTEESALADKEALSDYRAASTVDSCKVGKSDVEEEGNRCKNSSIDVSDEETGFVKL